MEEVGRLVTLAGVCADEAFGKLCLSAPNQRKDLSGIQYTKKERGKHCLIIVPAKVLFLP